MPNPMILPWQISVDDCTPEKKQFYESIFCLGNGYMGAMGFAPEEEKPSPADRCTYLSGFYEYIKPGITDMVNTPDFSTVSIAVDGRDISRENKINCMQRLDMKTGLMVREYTVEDQQGRRTRLEISRFFSMEQRHLAVLRFSLTPENYSGTLEFRTGINGNSANRPIADNQLSENDSVIALWDTAVTGAEGLSGWLVQRTRPSGRAIAEAYAVRTDWANDEPDAHVSEDLRPGYAGVIFRAEIRGGCTYTVDKFVGVYCFRDAEPDSLPRLARECAGSAAAKGFERLLEENAAVWAEKWETADIKVDNDEIQGAIRYNIFQLIQTDPEDDPKASIGARGIMNGRYKGCYFWDTEIFMFPFFLFTNPKAARNLLMYRYHTLGDAIESANRFSLEGARYSWMCSDTGFEQCETWDTGCCEVHITADVAYAVQQYADVTGDEEFMRDYGTEMLVQTARYWKSRLTYDSLEDMYNMLFVKGPDEYCGVTLNNTYTNWLVRENLKNACAATDWMVSRYPRQWEALRERLSYREEERRQWEDIVQKIKIGYDAHTSLFIQDDLFLKSEPLDIQKNKTDDSPLYRRISYDRLQRYRALKQPDVLMMMILYPDRFTGSQKKAAWDFYEPLTLHDSTLSFGSHAQMAANIGEKEKAESYFLKSIFLDLKDIMKNTATEGIHTASLGAAWKALTLGFAGLRADAMGMRLEAPMLPEMFNKLEFTFFYRGERYRATVDRDEAHIEPAGRGSGLR